MTHRYPEPAVSVVIPVYNAEDTVAQAVKSILTQTLTSLELIVIDDGSTDDTSTVLRQFSDTRLRVLSADHRGVAAAANAGTQETQAPLIARMDADDVSTPDRLAQQRHLLESDDLDVVGSFVRMQNANGSRTLGMERYERWINEETRTPNDILALRFVEFPLVNPTLLARRSYFQQGYSDDGLPEDYALMLRGAEQGMRFGKVPRVLLHWTDSPNRLTRTGHRYTTTAFENCRRRHLLQGPLKGVKTVDLWGAGRTGKPWLRWLQQQGIVVRHLYDVSRRKIGNDIHGVTVVVHKSLVDPDGTPLLIAVGAAGARSLIRSFITEREYSPGVDAWFVA